MNQENLRPESIPQYFKKVIAHLQDGTYCLLGSHSDISAENLLEEDLWDELEDADCPPETIDKIEFASPDMPKIFYHVATTNWSLGEIYSFQLEKTSTDILLEKIIKLRENK